MQNQEEPEKTLDRVSWFGKMSRVLSPVIKDEISEQSSKKLSGSFAKKPPMFLCLKTDGRWQDVSMENPGPGPWLGAYSMLNFGESPSVDVESHLSQILEGLPPQKYYLSAKACQGVLNRAKRRGKDLPSMLKEALLNMIQFWESPPPYTDNPQWV